MLSRDYSVNGISYRAHPHKGIIYPNEIYDRSTGTVVRDLFALISVNAKFSFPLTHSLASYLSSLCALVPFHDLHIYGTCISG